MTKVPKNTWLFRLMNGGTFKQSRVDRKVNELIDTAYSKCYTIEEIIAGDFWIWYKLSDNVYVNRTGTVVCMNPKIRSHVTVSLSTYTRTRLKKLLLWSAQLKTKLDTEKLLDQIFEEDNNV